MENPSTDTVTNRRSGMPLLRVGRPPLYLVVVAGLVAVAMVLPLLYLIIQAIESGWVIFEYLQRGRTLQIIGRSFLLVGLVSVGSVAIALPVAWITVRTDLPFRQIWAVLTILPLVIPSYVGAFVVALVLGPRGMLQTMLEPIGVERLPEIYGLPGAALTLTILSYPYVLLPVRAMLLRLDPAFEESSRVLGSGPKETFFRSTVPIIRPAIASGALLTGLYALSDFGAVSLMRYETFTWAIFLQYESFNRELAATLSIILIGCALVILNLESKFRGRGRYARIGTGSARVPKLALLGAWRWPCLFACFCLVSVSLVMPISVLSYWVVRGLAIGENPGSVSNAMINSVYASVVAAFFAVCMSLPVAGLSIRYPSRISTLLERISYTGYTLPGIVVALSLVFFGLNVFPQLYQTFGLLAFSYLVLFLPVALSPIRSSLSQLNPRLEEAARTLGHNPIQVLWSIVIPSVRPGLVAGFVLVFLVTIKELPATLILSPIGFKTLATTIWAAASEAFFARAAFPALLLIVVSGVMLGLGTSLDRSRR
jgi:iron(III) transport system permease protein